MKTKLLLLSALLSGLCLSAQPLDLIHQDKFQKRLNTYVVAVHSLCEKTRQTNSADSVKLYAKQIMRLSDAMEVMVNRHYRIREAEFRVVPILSGNKINYAFVNLPGDRAPAEIVLVNTIYDKAVSIRFLHAGKSSKKINKLRDIEVLAEEILSL